jgi:beta-lactamase class A
MAQTATASLPSTRVGIQARWFVGAVTHWPIPTAEIKAHFDSTFLAQVPPAELDATLKGVISVQVGSVTASTPDALVFVVTVNGQTKLSVSIAVDSAGLIAGLRLAPVVALPAPPSTWPGADRMVRSVAPQVRFLVASVSKGTCRSVQAIDATTPAPLGSAFKLYVLDALAHAIASGKVSWAQKLTVTSQAKSLPSGALQDDPDGTRLSVQQVASDMISISDNTAEDMLAGLLGRAAVEQATRTSGMADPALDLPFLTTRELFVLKLDDWPKLAQRYLALGTAGRLAVLAGTVDHDPLKAADLSPWTVPRDVGSIEWFASPTDICHVYASLAALAKQPRLAPVARILSLNNGDMDLPPSQWRSVWFKGGSEPGVLTLNYLATTTSGKTYVVSVLAEDPTAPISQTSATLTLLSAIKGAFELAAQGVTP